MKHLFKLRGALVLMGVGLLAFNCSKDDSENSGNLRCFMLYALSCMQ